MLTGIDFSFGGGVTTAQIKAAGYQFVCRYLSGGNSKDISAAELVNYHAAGIPVVFVWETTGTDMISTGQGTYDATQAQKELNELAIASKIPAVALAPVFFAADAATEPELLEYLRGSASVVSHKRNGLYGGYANIKAAFDAGVVSYGWQTSAWSNGQWDSRALLRQTGQVQVGPATCDVDQAAFWADPVKVLGMNDDFGQFPTPVPNPPAPPKLPQFPLPASLNARAEYKLELSWSAVAGASQYQYQVTEGSNIVVNDALTSATSVVIPVAGNGTYKWRLAVPADSGHRASEWSSWQSVSV